MASAVWPGLCAADEAAIRGAIPAYATAERWVARPLIADYVTRRANRSLWVHDRLTGVINERDLPNRIFSVRSNLAAADPTVRVFPYLIRAMVSNRR